MESFLLGDGFKMKWVIIRILISVIGITLFALELILEIDGIPGFLLATVGLFLIIIGLAFKGLVKVFANLI